MRKAHQRGRAAPPLLPAPWPFYPAPTDAQQVMLQGKGLAAKHACGVLCASPRFQGCTQKREAGAWGPPQMPLWGHLFPSSAMPCVGTSGHSPEAPGPIALSVPEPATQVGAQRLSRWPGDGASVQADASACLAVPLGALIPHQNCHQLPLLLQVEAK